jgi:hypothetical protein
VPPCTPGGFQRKILVPIGCVEDQRPALFERSEFAGRPERTRSGTWILWCFRLGCMAAQRPALKSNCLLHPLIVKVLALIRS